MKSNQERKRIERAEKCLEKIKNICSSNKERKIERIQNEVDYYFNQKENESFPSPIVINGKEIITGAIQIKKEIDWEWDGTSYVTLYEYEDKQYERWSELFRANLQDFQIKYNEFYKDFINTFFQTTFAEGKSILGADIYWMTSIKHYIETVKSLTLKQIKCVIDFYKRYKINL